VRRSLSGFWTILFIAILAMAAAARTCLDYADYGGPNGAPPLAGSLMLAAEALDLAVQAGHAYLACGSAGLQIVELSDPTAPVWVGAADLLGDAVTVDVLGDHAFVGVGSTIKVVDITSADSPIWTQTFSAVELVRHIVVAGETILAAADSSGLVVIDGQAVPLFSSVSTVTTARPARSVAGSVDGSTAWVATAAGVEIVALDGGAPYLTGTLVLGRAARTVVADADVLWVATDDGLLIACDVTDPRTPREMRRHATPSPSDALLLADGFLYQAGADGLTRVAGVGRRGTLVTMGSIPTPGMTHAVVGVGSHVYLADGAEGLQVAWRQCDIVTAVGPLASARARLVGAVPNPIGPGSTIVFRLGEACNVRVGLHDARGREVALLLNEQRPAGAHQIQWDGRLLDGRRAPAGVWYVRMDAGGTLETKSVAVLR